MSQSKGSSKKAAMAKDTIIYMVAKGIEGIVGIVTMSVMTYLFATAQMGRYSTVNIAVTTVGMVSIQWLVQSVLRYINKYDIQGKKREFFSTVFGAWFKVNVIVTLSCALLAVILVASSGSFAAVEGFIAKYSPALLFLSVMWLVTYNTAQLVIAMLAALREAKLNLLLSMITVIGRIVFLVILCKLFTSKIEWIFLSYFITDAIVCIIGLKRLKIFAYLKNGSKGSSEILDELKQYGMPLMGNMLTTSVLNKSDIYIIALLITDAAAGIYQTNYSLIATAFTLLSASVMRGSYPTILRTWAEGDKNGTAKLISEAVRFYLLLAIPAVVGVAATSEVISTALFEKNYVEGHTVMFWVAFGMMMLGLTEYSIKPWELTANTGAIFKRSLIGGAVNVALNLVLISVTKNYFIASVTTFIGFLVYFLLARFGTKSELRWHISLKSFLKILISALLMYAFIYILKKIMPVYTKLSLIVFIFGGMVMYGLSLYLSGEVKNEVKTVINKFKNK